MNKGAPRTITLWDKPVQVYEEDWPVFSRGRTLFGNRRQHLSIRRHADGRYLVYGTNEEHGPNSSTLRGGEVVPADKTLPEVLAILREVAKRLKITDGTVSDVIANLPPEQL